MKKNFIVSKETLSTQNFELNPQTQNLAIVFGPQDSMSKEVTEQLKKQDPKIKVVGLGTSNCFVNSKTVESGQMAVSVLQFKDTDVHTVCVPNAGYETTLENSAKIAAELSSKSTKEKPLKGVLLFAEGLNINGADLPRPFAKLNIPVCGGLAAETDFKFQKTQVFYEGQELANHIVAVGFYGESFTMESFADTGMKSVGVLKKITKSDKNILHMVEGKTAIEWYLDYMAGKNLGADFKGVEPSESLSYPVAIYKDGQNPDGAIRTPIGFLYEEGSNNRKGSIVFTGEIPEGHYLKMMFASPDDLIEQCEKSVTTLETSSTEQAVIHLSCSARQMLLAQLTPYEYDKSTDSIGAYVYGEIATINNESKLLNQTFTSIRISEKKAA